MASAYHPPGWLAGGTEEVESAIDGQSLLASGLRQARGKEVSMVLSLYSGDTEPDLVAIE